MGVFGDFNYLDNVSVFVVTVQKHLLVNSELLVTCLLMHKAVLIMYVVVVSM